MTTKEQLENNWEVLHERSGTFMPFELRSRIFDFFYAEIFRLEALVKAHEEYEVIPPTEEKKNPKLEEIRKSTPQSVKDEVDEMLSSSTEKWSKYIGDLQREVFRLKRELQNSSNLPTPNTEVQTAEEIYKKLWNKWVYETFGQDAAINSDFEEVKDSSKFAIEAMEEYASLKSLKAQQRIEEMDDSIGNLLAILHGDGGHYQQKHGIKKACEDAIDKYYQRVTEIDNLQQRIKELEEKLEFEIKKAVQQITDFIKDWYNNERALEEKDFYTELEKFKKE